MSEEPNEQGERESEGGGFGRILDTSQGLYGRRRWATIIAVLLVVAVSWLSVIDRKTENYVDNATVQALAAYGTLRLANSAVSTIKSAEIDAQLASIRLGAALDPVDDLVEEGSNVVRFAIGSLITQKLMVEIVSTTFFKVLLTVAALLLIGSLFIQGGRYSGFCMKAFALAGLARFLFVLVVFLNGMADQAFVEDKAQSTQKNLESTSKQLGQVQQQAGSGLSKGERTELESEISALEDQKETLLASIDEAEKAVEGTKKELEEAQARLSKLEEKKGFVEQYFPEDSEHQALVERVEKAEQAHRQAVAELDSYTEELTLINEEVGTLEATLSGENQGWMAAATQQMSAVREMLDVTAIKDKAEAMIDSILRLMALFVLQTVIIPIIFLVLLLKGFRYIWGIDARTLAAQQWQNAKNELEK